jgi:folate-binding protein YgfZ
MACVSASVWQSACIDAGLVVVTEATAERFLPQMLGLVTLDAVDFDKGCYLGQEVVARAQHRGQVKRQLVRLHGRADLHRRPDLHGGPGEEAEIGRESLAADAIAALPGKALTNDAGRDVGVIVAAVSVRDEASVEVADQASDKGTTGTSTHLDCLAVAGPSLPATCFVDGIEFERSGEGIS